MIHQRQVEIDEREPGLDLRRSLVVEFRQLQIAGVVVEVSQVVVRLNMPRIVLQRAREVIERTRGLPALEIDDAEIAVRFGNVVAFIDRFEVMLRCFRVTLLV